MLSMIRRRQDPDTLIWEYLDGDISPRRANRLSRLIERRATVRERLVESAMLHGMLCTYYRGESATPEIELDVAAEDDMPARKRRYGKSSAA